MIPGLGRSPGEGIGYPLQYAWTFLLAQLIKESAFGQRINFKNIQAAHTTQYQKHNPIKKWEKDSDISPKKTSRWLTNTWKDAQHLSLLEKCKSKTTMRYHLTLVRMAIIKKSTNNKCWRGCGEKGTLLNCWWDCELIQPLLKTVWRLLKKQE